MFFTVVSLALALATGSAADIKGKWEGKIVGERPDRNQNPRIRRSSSSDQKDSTITGYRRWQRDRPASDHVWDNRRKQGHDRGPAR